MQYPKSTPRKSILAVLIVLIVFGCPRAQDRGLGVVKSKSDPRDNRKAALVIGNGSYKISPLRNPPTDAKDMAVALASVGFDVVCKTDLNQNEMKKAIRAFGETIRQGGIGLFYFAGHAVQVDGRNYLIPVGSEITHEHEVEYEAVDVGVLLSQMQQAHNQLNIVILDACRNNPFSRKFRSTSDGLASISAPSGTLIAYATAPGSVASDGDGRNGLYTQELLRAMREPSLKIEEVFKRVRAAVQDRTGGLQVPWESSSLVGDFYFLPTGLAAKTAPLGGDGISSLSPGRVEPTRHDAPPSQTRSSRSPLSRTAAEVFVKQGDAAAKQKRWTEAETEYKQAVDLDPTDAKLRVKLGDVLSQQQKWLEAEIQYAAAVQAEPQNKSYQDRLTAARNRNK